MSGPHLIRRRLLLPLLLIGAAAPASAQNETPSSHVAVVVAPSRFEFDSGENTFLFETGAGTGQQYITLSLQETVYPDLSPTIDLLDHIERVNGTYSTGVLLHTGHGGDDHSIIMESFTDANDAAAMAAAQARLAAYASAGWNTAGPNREIEVAQVQPGRWAIYMFDRAITNRGAGLATDKPLVYIACCYGELMGPAYVGKGARVAVGNIGGCMTPTSAQHVRTFFRRMNGREGQGMRPVSQARAGQDLGATGAENTTLAPSVLSLASPCPIKTGDLVTFTLDTKCATGIIPDIVGTACTIDGEVWLSPTQLRGTCTSPPYPGSNDFKLRLKWDNVYSSNNTARLDGNTAPSGINACCPAHDDYEQSFSCSYPPVPVPGASRAPLIVVGILLGCAGGWWSARRRKPASDAPTSG